MLPPTKQLTAVLSLSLCLFIPSNAFLVVSTGQSLSSGGSTTESRKGRAVSQPARGETWQCHDGDWCASRSSPTSPTSFVLQASADGSEQLREQDQAAERQAASRSKQMNIACNDVVRTILDGNPTNEKERAEALRQRLIAQRDDLVTPEDDMSELFFDNLLLVCQHELHPDVGKLRGSYGKAWHTILHYIEDAGWQLTDPPFSISG